MATDIFNSAFFEPELDYCCCYFSANMGSFSCLANASLGADGVLVIFYFLTLFRQLEKSVVDKSFAFYVFDTCNSKCCVSELLVVTRRIKYRCSLIGII